ncbi:MAG: alpha/beta hydrolase [Rhodopseudomonas palustris]|uniref:Alpha/beta hydrolase n=1 Tax=Rhodopseudomonas palustris TaxID=1076 RepID=A0A933S1G3_RHOPL|nr:alpha/beta hydrolase [Rhodopseudomonas palustris]
MTDVRVISSGGLKLAGSTFGQHNRNAILLLHGHSNSRDTWEELVAKLGIAFEVWAIDFRGHGDSEHAASYDLAGYVADAEAALAAIGRPAIVVGHSLGACVAGRLAQDRHQLVQSVFLEDPPWYLGSRTEWDRTAFATIFPASAAKQAELQRRNAPIADYLEFISNAPSPMGGQNSDHFSFRQLYSHASALQRQDNHCWASVTGGTVLAAIDVDRPFARPATILRSDPNCGAAFLHEHEARMRHTNPDVTVLYYEGCGHGPHRTMSYDARFHHDLLGFVRAYAM